MQNYVLHLFAVGSCWVLYKIYRGGVMVAEGKCRDGQTITFIY